jgi:hypothetical protein
MEAIADLVNVGHGKNDGARGAEYTFPVVAIEGCPGSSISRSGMRAPTT